MKTILSALLLGAALVTPALGDDNTNALDYSVLSQASERDFALPTIAPAGRASVDHENRVRAESWRVIEQGTPGRGVAPAEPVTAPEAWTGRAG
jgi:hypothetical protein